LRKERAEPAARSVRASEPISWFYLITHFSHVCQFSSSLGSWLQTPNTQSGLIAVRLAFSCHVNIGSRVPKLSGVCFLKKRLDRILVVDEEKNQLTFEIIMGLFYQDRFHAVRLTLHRSTQLPQFESKVAKTISIFYGRLTRSFESPG